MYLLAKKYIRALKGPSWIRWPCLYEITSRLEKSYVRKVSSATENLKDCLSLIETILSLVVPNNNHANRFLHVARVLVNVSGQNRQQTRQHGRDIPSRYFLFQTSRSSANEWSCSLGSTGNYAYRNYSLLFPRKFLFYKNKEHMCQVKYWKLFLSGEKLEKWGIINTFVEKSTTPKTELDVNYHNYMRFFFFLRWRYFRLW